MSSLPAIFIANWKMHTYAHEAKELATACANILSDVESDIVLCPPFPWLSEAAVILKNSSLMLGAQDCHDHDKGAYTGSVSASMLKDAGCQYVILGHSERRHGLSEGDDLVKAKAKQAGEQGLTPVVCVGETQEEKEAGNTLAVIERQILSSIPRVFDSGVIAYEPVWAIGSGNIPTQDEISEVHQFIHGIVTNHDAWHGAGVRVAYGGSVKPDSAAAIRACQGVDGMLVGGASLNADSFAAIVNAGK
jgi:triosephosphate isomerase